MQRAIYLAVFCATILAFAAGGVHAEPIIYDAASGQLPQDVGWTFSDEDNPPSTVTVADGILTHSSAFTNRSRWDIFPHLVNGTPTDAGIFVETVARVVSLTVDDPVRGVGIGAVAVGNAGLASVLRFNAKTDRILVVDDITEEILASVPMDTTDAFHVYRIELLEGRFWVFVDGEVVVTNTAPLYPSGSGLWGSFGDGSAKAASVTEYKSVVIGSLADIDTDGDGIPDYEDAFPNDPTEQTDNDGDGIGDNADPDDDNDGLTDEEEAELGTDPNLADTDGDGVPDGEDVFPRDPGCSSIESCIRDLRDFVIPAMFDADFQNPSMRRPLHNKLTALIEMVREIEAEPDDEVAAILILEAVDKVEHDLIAKTDGFFEGNPQNDWVITVEGQETLLPLLSLVSDALLDAL